MAAGSPRTSIRDLLDLTSQLEKKGVHFRSLKENFDTTTASGHLMFHFFAALTEFERGLITERTHAGLKAARARGRLGGRRRVLSAQQASQVRILWDSQKQTEREIAQQYGVSIATIDRICGQSPCIPNEPPEGAPPRFSLLPHPTVFLAQVFLWLVVHFQDVSWHEDQEPPLTVTSE